MLFSKFKRDRGDSTLVSTIVVIPLIVAFLITSIDSTIYLLNRQVILTSARDATRTVAIFGGDGTNTVETGLEKQYGSPTNPCAGNLRNSPVIQTPYDPYTHSSAIECQLMSNLASSNSLTNVQIKDVTCGPKLSTFIGQQAYCEITWSYPGLPGSGLTLMRAAGNANLKAGQGLDADQKTRVTSTTEVNLSGEACFNRTSGARVQC